jgi:hypothetical protein
VAKKDQTSQMFSHFHALMTRTGARNIPQHNPQVIARSKPRITDG